MSAHGLLEKGMGWRICDGEYVIWNDPWIPGLGDGWIRC